jgi:hypothetical protein
MKRWKSSLNLKYGNKWRSVGGLIWIFQSFPSNKKFARKNFHKCQSLRKKNFMIPLVALLQDFFKESLRSVSEFFL